MSIEIARKEREGGAGEGGERERDRALVGFLLLLAFPPVSLAYRMASAHPHSG